MSLQHVELTKFVVTMDVASTRTRFATTLTTAEITVTKEAARIHHVSFACLKQNVRGQGYETHLIVWAPNHVS